MKRLLQWMMAAILICGTTVFTACSSDDDANKDNELTIEKLVGVWVTDYSQSGTEGDLSWNRVVEDYQFNADGTGYYERYLLDDELLVAVKSVRDADTFHYTISGNTVAITGDENNMAQTLTYADGRLTAQGKTLQKATDEQQTLVDQLYAEWSGGNSAVKAKITYISRSWNGEKVVDNEVSTDAWWLNQIQKEEGSYYSTWDYWYVTGNHTMEGGLRVTNGRELNIILCDDATLTLSKIFVEGESTLRIFGQKRGTGQLIINNPKDGYCAIGTHEKGGGNIEIHGGNITAKGGDRAAAIGECCYGTNNQIWYFNNINIYGGTINATGGDGAAAIGGSLYSNGHGNLNIYGGDITAQGGGYVVYDLVQGGDFYGGAGIGGGCCGPIASVNIYGGNVHATGGSEAAGIGCGESAEGKGRNGTGSINIYGGNVEASGKDHAAGIGGGDGVYLEKIFISGGDVKAYGGVNAAGIGGGEGVQGGNIEITGGTVHAYAGADGAGIGGGEDGDGGTITISGGLVFAYGNYHSDGFGAGIGGGQDGNSGTITIKGGEVHAYGGDDAAGIGTGEETTSGPNIKADNITISGGTVEAVGGGYGAGVGAGQDAEVGTITITMESGSVYVSGRSGNDCGWWAGAFGAYDEDDRGTLNIGKGVKTMSIETDYSWSTIPVAWNPVAFAQQRCHVQIQTCDHPGGHTAETCIYCKH